MIEFLWPLAFLLLLGLSTLLLEIANKKNAEHLGNRVGPTGEYKMDKAALKYQVETPLPVDKQAPLGGASAKKSTPPPGMAPKPVVHVQQAVDPRAQQLPVPQAGEDRSGQGCDRGSQ